QRARGPEDHLLAPEGDRDLEDSAGGQREKDLGDRDAEVEPDLPDHLERRDRRGQMQARITQLRQEDGGTPAPDRDRCHCRRKGTAVPADYYRPMRLIQARAIVDHVVANAGGPVSVFVADTHGELVAAATMDGAAPDTRLNAQRKAYTAARSDARSTYELAEK